MDYTCVHLDFVYATCIPDTHTESIMCKVTIKYSSTQLIDLRPQGKPPFLDKSVYKQMLQWGCARNTPTKRGSTAGNRKNKRPIQVCVTRRYDANFQHGQSGCNKNNLHVIHLPKWDLPHIANINARSLLPKMDELATIMQISDIGVAAVTETWLGDHVPKSAIEIAGYRSYRHDRVTKTTGGGVICYVREDPQFRIKEWKELYEENMESVWVTVRPRRLPRSVSILCIGVIYHPPTADHQALHTHLCKCIDHIRRHHPSAGFIITGDFNTFPDRKLQLQCRLKQIVTVPTRGTSILDKIYTNMVSIYCSPTTASPLGTADHDMVTCEPCVDSSFNTGEKYTVLSRIMGNNERAMFAMDIRNIKWEELYHMSSCAEQFDFLQTTIMVLVDKHFPWKSVTRHTNDRPWVTDTYRYLVRRRQRAHKMKDQEQYNLYRNKVNKMGEKLKYCYYKNKVADLKSTKPTQWWRDMKLLMGEKPTRSDTPMQDLANNVCDGDLDILVNQINTFFTSLCDNMPALKDNNRYAQYEHNYTPDRYIITVEKVERQLLSLKVKKAPGPDMIPTWILKDFAPVLAGPIAAVWNSSIREGYLPVLWRSAFLAPLPKKTPAQQVEKDIRPISLTPILCKELEVHPVQWIWECVTDKIDPKQFGTVKGSSTIHALVELLHHCYHNTDGSKKYARLLLLDYTKAFDLINHHILMNKLVALDLPPFLLRWIAAFLTDRRQQVRIGDHSSEWMHLKGGVPQGTRLGPVLFILMINDLQLESCKTYKYVDDTNALQISNDAQSDSLQLAANEASQWSKDNDMVINPTKTKELIINFSITKFQNFRPLYIDETEIERVTEAKTLGIIIRDDLKWNTHVDAITSKAGKRIHMLSQMKKAGVPVTDITQMYCAKIRPLLEYACQAWHPGLTDYLSTDIERIQKRAMWITYPNLTYDVALKLSGLKSLAERREQLCIDFVNSMKDKDHKLHHLLPAVKEHKYRLRMPSRYEPPKLDTYRARGSLVNWYLWHQQQHNH